MGQIDLYNVNSSPNFGIVLAILSMLPWILIYTIFKPKFKRVKSSQKAVKLEIANIIIYMTNIIILVGYKDRFDIKTANIWFGVMTFFYLIYYELFIRYIIRGRAQKELYMPFMYIKVPLFISMSLALVFAGIWAKCMPLIYFSILFTITNCYIAYKKYMRFFTEYRDLYDENRKPTGKKMLMDGVRPKGLKYVTVIVFIYNNKKLELMMGAFDMYERSAIVLERYFENLLDYRREFNLRDNFNNYCELIEKLDKFQLNYQKEVAATESYNESLRKIKSIQLAQEKLYKKSAKMEYSRNL